MRGAGLYRYLLTGVSATVLVAAASPAMAQEIAFDVPAGPASRTVPIFAKQAGTQIIGNANELRDRRTKALKGRYTLEEGLGRLLAGTGLNRISSEGEVLAIGLVRRGNAQTASSAEGREADDAGTAEILVVGRRSRNVDIRRTEDDSQPYVVFNRQDIEQSQAVTVEEFLRTRLPQNSTPEAESQATGNGRAFSSFNLRGLGANQTLILVNGRRLPTLNNQDLRPRQADINGIPVGSIERIEVLPSSAGGIYGGNAVGGVINIILRSDYRGLDLTATYNDTFDFELPSGRLDINGGFALEGGRTTFTFGGSIARSGTLLVGERSEFAEAGLALFRKNNSVLSLTQPPVANGVNIRSANGQNLVLKPQFGGANLGSAITNVPLGYAGVASDSGALLRANAGTYNLDIPDDLNGLRRGLVTTPDISSFNLNARRKFSDWLDAFVDYGHFENKGTTFSVSSLSNRTNLAANNPLNPFQQAVRISYPLPNLSFPFVSASNTDTVAVGAIIRLPYKWGVNLEYSKTWSKTAVTGYFQAVPDAVSNCYRTGGICPDGTRIDPFRSPIDLSPFIYDEPTFDTGPARSTFDNPSLRASGPIFKLPGGDAALTVAVQKETTKIAPSRLVSSDGTETGKYYTFYQPKEQSTTSGYTELVLPLVSPRNGVPFVHELELRGAVRYDSYYTEAPPAGFTAINYLIGGVPFNIPGGLEQVLTSDPDVIIPEYTPVESRFKSTNYTLAGRFSPVRGITFRASYATGFLPPGVTQIASTRVLSSQGLGGLPDPIRGNERVDYPLEFIQGGGSTALRPEKSQTLSAGVILTPLKGFRFSADYTRIRKRDEVSGIPTDFLLANPDLFPGRVVRAPASDGFSVGRILTVDVTPINLLRSKVEAVDFQLDYNFTDRRLGDFRIYAVATWQPDTIRQLLVNAPALNYTGNRGGVLEWQGNAGFDWTLNDFSVRWNTQFYDSYNIFGTFDPNTPSGKFAIDDAIQTQGSRRVRSQTYSDIYLSYDFKNATGLLSGFGISAGIQNIFNERPPIIATASFLQTPYSTYGDIRLRRFTIRLRKSFGTR